MAITLNVEAISVDTVNLKWLDSVNPSNTHTINRSTDGVSYTVITVASAGATTAQDAGLATETKYWYKITEGATTSNIETVWTQKCFEPAGREIGASLPQSGDENVSSDLFNQAMSQLESLLQTGNEFSATNCDPCISDHTLVIDCSTGCTNFRVDVDQNVNSISILGCGDQAAGNIEFAIPASVCRNVCGFPSGFGFEGNECFDASLCGGTNGRTINVAFVGGSSIGVRGSISGGVGPRATTPSGTGGSGTSGSGSGGSGGGSALAVTCQTSAGGANATCSMDCASAKAMRFRVTGGRTPYVASTNSGGTITVVSAGIYSLTPPANAGSGVAGVAYVKYGGTCVDGGGVPTACPGAGFASYDATYGCNDVVIAACGQVFSGPNVGNCCNTPLNLGLGSCGSITPCHDAGVCTNGSCDARTAAMIASNCKPCGSVMPSKTFTITDADGTSIVTVLKA